MTRDYEVFEEITASKQEVMNCSYSKWYETFRPFVVESKVLKPLPREFLDYLAAESIRLPRDDVVLEANSDNEYSDWSEDEDGDTDESQSVDAKKDPTEGFEDLHREIQRVVEEFKAVAPKLNWSAPKDCTWIMINNTMRCDSASDVYLMLNSSDHITHDLDFPFEDTTANGSNEGSDVEYELVLRKWQEINPALEFRVFVRDQEIVGKSQRDLNYYDYLQQLIIDNKINDKINRFIYKEVIPKFGNRSFIVDIYCPRPFDNVMIIDINPFTRITDSILYTWNELLTDKEDLIRLITETNIGRFKTKAYSENQVPLDVVQASQDPNSLVELAREWQINEKSDVQPNAN